MITTVTLVCTNSTSVCSNLIPRLPLLYLFSQGGQNRVGKPGRKQGVSRDNTDTRVQLGVPVEPRLPVQGRRQVIHVVHCTLHWCTGASGKTVMGILGDEHAKPYVADTK